MKKALAIILIASIALSAAFSRPTVGLVLSGGGAKGIAHVGVIEVLEELGIPIDYITGTSMGSLIGGLYAAGYTTGDINRLMDSNDLTELFLITGNFDKTSASHAFEPLSNPIKIGFDSEGVGNSNGLIGDQRILALFNSATIRVGAVRDFDDLSIPYRAVGVDTISGDEFVFKSGVLSAAMRSSMSIPVAFEPYEVDGHWYVDGGLRNNTPVSVMIREFNPDIIITVDINGSQSVTDISELRTITSMMNQTFRIAVTTPNNTNFSDSDVYILPKLGDYGIMDFSYYREIVEIGRQGALEKIDELAEIAALFEEDEKRYVSPDDRGPYFDLEVPVVGNILHEDRSNGEISFSSDILARFRPLIGEPLDEENLNYLAAQIEILRSNRLVSSASYHIEDGDDGKVNLVIETRSESLRESSLSLHPDVHLSLFRYNNDIWYENPGWSFSILPDMYLNVALGSPSGHWEHGFSFNYKDALELGGYINYPLFTGDGLLSVQADAFARVGNVAYANYRANLFRESAFDVELNASFRLSYVKTHVGSFALEGNFNFFALGQGRNWILRNEGGNESYQVPRRNIIFPFATVDLVFGAESDSIIFYPGYRVDVLGIVGYDFRQTEAQKEAGLAVNGNIAYSAQLKAHYNFNISEAVAMQVRAAAGVNRAVSDVTTFYPVYGGWTGLVGLPAGLLAHDFWNAALGVQVRLTHGYTNSYLQFKTAVGMRTSEDPEQFIDLERQYATDVTRAPFSSLGPVEVGFGLGYGIDILFADIFAGIGVTTSGTFSVYVEIH